MKRVSCDKALTSPPEVQILFIQLIQCTSHEYQVCHVVVALIPLSSSERRQRVLLLYQRKSIMRRSLFEPDYSSTTTFPRFSVVPCCANPALSQRQNPEVPSLSSSSSSSSLPNKQEKHVQFSPSNKNQVYWIQRRDSQRLSIRTEAVLNRMAIIQLQIQKQREELQVLEKIESKLISRCHAENIRLLLEARIHALDQDIWTMRQDMMHFQNETTQLLDLAATQKRLRDQDAIVKEENHPALVFSKTRLELLLIQLGSAFASEESSTRAAHMSSTESKEPTARCA